MERNTTEALDQLVQDERFNGDTKARISDHNEAQVMLFTGHAEEQREIIRSEYGLEIEHEERGVRTGDRVATVVDPDGDDPEPVKTNESAEEAISAW